jgi:molybdate transport system substrate-binding protein
LDVLAAASLTEAFGAMESEFESAHPDIDVEFSFGASSELAAQIEAGAPADVIAAADERSLATLGEHDRIGESRVFATNRLEIAVSPGNPDHIATVADLADDDLVVVLCDPDVPCGAYTETLLSAAHVEVAAASLEPNVKGVATKVALGEADAGIVYATDVLAAGAQIDGVTIPAAINIEARYPIGIINGSPDQQAARAFISFVVETEGQAVLRAHGFAAP